MCATAIIEAPTRSPTEAPRTPKKAMRRVVHKSERVLPIAYVKAAKLKRRAAANPAARDAAANWKVTAGARMNRLVRAVTSARGTKSSVSAAAARGAESTRATDNTRPNE